MSALHGMPVRGVWSASWVAIRRNGWPRLSVCASQATSARMRACWPLPSPNTRFLANRVAYGMARRAGEFVAQDLANTAWAFAAQRVTFAPAAMALARASARRVGEFSPGVLATSAWALASLLPRSAEMEVWHDAMHANVVARPHEFSASEVGQMARAMFAFRIAAAFYELLV